MHEPRTVQTSYPAKPNCTLPPPCTSGAFPLDSYTGKVQSELLSSVTVIAIRIPIAPERSC